ncbi:MAG: hypothetical protein IJT16_08565 [Lachnospiraceae bacterium]|nr:hypothetical protein [Lachnospiraceae bacterium]
MSMEINGVTTNQTIASNSTVAVQRSAESGVSRGDADVETVKKQEEAAVYEKSEEVKNAPYSINKMSKEDRASLVDKLNAEVERQKQQFADLVNKTIAGQAGAYGKANGDDFWKMLSGGNYTVDAATKAQAQKDIGEDGYWGVKQTSQRLFDFASALAGDDVDQMKKMQAAMEKGFKQATNAWGRDLPSISNDTLSAANKLFEDYYKSKESEASSGGMA